MYFAQCYFSTTTNSDFNLQTTNPSNPAISATQNDSFEICDEPIRSRNSRIEN